MGKGIVECSVEPELCLAHVLVDIAIDEIEESRLRELVGLVDQEDVGVVEHRH